MRGRCLINAVKRSVQVARISPALALRVTRPAVCQPVVQRVTVRSFAAAAAAEVKEVVPTLGDSITEGNIIEWAVEPGQWVEVDQVLATIETDKTSSELRAKTAGVLKEQLVKKGDPVKVNAPFAVIDPSAAKPAAAAAAAKPAAPAAAAPSAPAAAAPAASAPAAAAPAAPAATPKPAAAASKPVAPVSFPVGSRGVTRERMTRMRETIARRLKDSQQNTASLTTFNEVDMSYLIDMRKKYGEEFEKTHGVKVGFMSPFVKASVHALRKFPMVNAYFDAAKSEIEYHDYCDIGVAVGTPTGLVVPILRNAEAMSLAQIEAAIKGYGEKARKNQLAIEDMTGGTFTISNGGVYGSLMGTPIINPPQTAILGMHAINKRPVVVGDKIEIRPMMYLALTYDHRMIDGATAVQFLKTIKQVLEDPVRLHLEL